MRMGSICLMTGRGLDWISVVARRLSWVTSCTPRAVSPEPIHPMTPRYMIRMDAPIRGAKALPKASIRSDVPVMDGLVIRNR